jgi:hypothetical protein
LRFINIFTPQTKVCFYIPGEQNEQTVTFNSTKQNESFKQRGKKRAPLVLSEQTVLVENEHSRKYVEKNTNAAQHVSDILS